jgi:CopG family nickel-responsive transcriptional regulator
MEKDQLVRFGVSMPQKLIEQFDESIALQGYDNRSEAVRDLVRRSLLEPRRLDVSQHVAGTIVMVYDHHAADLPLYLMELQHNFHHEIISTMHIHLNHNQCLEVIVVRGVLEQLRKLHQQIQIQKGVLFADLSVTHIDDDSHPHHDHSHVHAKSHSDGHRHEHDAAEPQSP